MPVPIRTNFNHCDLSPWYLASTEFNANPHPIHLQGVRRENHYLFRMLDELEDALRRSEVFQDYMSVKFHLHEWERFQKSARMSLRNSYLKFIRNWGFDSNSPSGAVLKSWVESRIGIPPTFHREPLGPHNNEAEARYRHDVVRGSSQTSAINLQLDLLYEFCQYELRRRRPGKEWAILYRGTHDPEEYEVIDTFEGGMSCVLLNNLSSFTSDRERAWEFGSTVWKVSVPLCKVFFFSGLLEENLLQGESEYLVIGGAYCVETVLF